MQNSMFSRVISGVMSWGKWGKELNANSISDLINHCVDHGISTFDHADIYGGYTTESLFGAAFIDSGVKREQIQIISKCGIQYLTDNRPNKVKHYNYSKEYIVWSVEESLKNLKTDYLDAILLHRPSPLMNPVEIMEAITKLMREGKIIAFGVSNFTPSQVNLISTELPVSINQIEFSLTENSAMYNGVLDQAIEHKIIPMAWSSLGLVFKETNVQTKRIHKQLEELSKKYNATKDQLLLAWIMMHPSNIHPVVGTTDKKRLLNAYEATKIKLDLEDWFLILLASQGHKVP